MHFYHDHNHDYSINCYDGGLQYYTDYGAKVCALLRTCRQLNADCNCLLFHYATLRVKVLDSFLRFLNDLSIAQLRSIRGIKVICRWDFKTETLVEFEYKEYVKDEWLFAQKLRVASDKWQPIRRS